VQVAGLSPVFEFYRKWRQPIEGLRMRWTKSQVDVMDVFPVLVATDLLTENKGVQYNTY
jgi:hypothetical protein